jgi:peptidoglycan/LPS O-acetylase OafA/YrhL
MLNFAANAAPLPPIGRIGMNAQTIAPHGLDTAGTSATYLPDSTMHLWFIYYLMYFYLLAVGVAWICRGLPASFRRSFTEKFVWMLFFGFTGLFLRYLDRPSRRVRYVVDASYWVYLVHLPCTIWIPGLIVGTDLTVWPRIGIVLIGTTIICFATYALFVRSTWIGKVLNGRRYSRGLPAGPTAATAQPAAPGAG